MLKVQSSSNSCVTCAGACVSENDVWYECECVRYECAELKVTFTWEWRKQWYQLWEREQRRWTGFGTTALNLKICRKENFKMDSLPLSTSILLKMLLNFLIQTKLDGNNKNVLNWTFYILRSLLTCWNTFLSTCYTLSVLTLLLRATNWNNNEIYFQCVFTFVFVLNECWTQ